MTGVTQQLRLEISTLRFASTHDGTNVTSPIENPPRIICRNNETGEHRFLRDGDFTTFCENEHLEVEILDRSFLANTVAIPELFQKLTRFEEGEAGTVRLTAISSVGQKRIIGDNAELFRRGCPKRAKLSQIYVEVISKSPPDPLLDSLRGLTESIQALRPTVTYLVLKSCEILNGMWKERLFGACFGK